MTEVPLSREDEDAALAGEYVLGVLDAAERAAVERRLRTDPAFAAEVAAWERKLGGLNDAFPAEPAPNLMPAIEARLFGKPARSGGMGRAGWWMRFVTGGAVAGILAILALNIVPPPKGVGPALQATLQAEGQALVFAARYDAGAGELTVTRTAGPEAEAGRVHELWLIADGKAPVPLGLIDAAELRIPLSALPEAAVLAVSLEPAGGSTTGAPTGPVLVTGVVTRL